MKEPENVRRLKAVKSDIKIIKDTFTELNKKLYELKLEKEKLENEIDAEHKTIEVTDHALIRYIERIYGLDVDRLKAEIASEEVTELIRKNRGKGKIPKDDYHLVLDNYKIVTIY